MSVRDSSDAPALTAAALAGPVIALANQGLIYMVNMWTCGHGMRYTAQIIPALCLIVTIAAGIVGYRALARDRFLAITGIGLNTFSAMVIVAQWAAILVFDPCMRA